MHEAVISLNRYGTRAKPVAIGDRFGFLVVVAEASPTRNRLGHRVRRVVCRCDCGVETVKEPKSIRNGGVKSCGCFARDVTRKRSTIHGATAGYQKHTLYETWVKMRSRCRNPADKGYDYYGARGITICDRWFASFLAFVEDMGPKPTILHSIDRIDNDGGYEPGNCRWADKTAQARNTRKNRIITVRGEEVVLAELAERAGLSESGVRARVRRGWHPDDIDLPPMEPAEAARHASEARWGRRVT